METMSIEEAKEKLYRILNRPLSLQEKIERFRESIFREYGTAGMKWGVRKAHRQLGAMYGMAPQAGGFKVKMAREMFGKHYKELTRPEKNLVKAALRNQGAIRPQGISSAREGERELREAKVLSMKPLGGGINDTKLVTLEGGIKAVFKTENKAIGTVRDEIRTGKDAEREVAAWQVAKLAGLEDICPPVVIRTIDGNRGSLMKFWDGKVAGALGRPEAWDGEKDLHRAAMFDYVIGNEDRHMGNWLVGNGKLQLIDHGLAFPDRGEFDYAGRHSNIKIMREVVFRDSAISVKEIGKSFVDNKDKILDALKEVGLPQAAIDGVGSRIDRIKRKDSWKGLFRR